MAKTLIGLKRTIKALKNTQKVTRTMELISRAKLQKSLQLVRDVNKFYTSLSEVASHVSQDFTHSRDAHLEQENVVIVMGSDRGLAGKYNTSITKFTHTWMQDKKNLTGIFIGKKSLSARYEPHIAQTFLYPASTKNFLANVFIPIWNYLSESKKTKQLNVTILYKKYLSSFSQEVVAEPIEKWYEDLFEEEAITQAKQVYHYEPDQEELVHYIQEMSMKLAIQHAYAHAQASEHTARMMAMKQATDSARDIIDSLTLEFNKMRQDLITQDLIQITNASTINV